MPSPADQPDLPFDHPLSSAQAGTPADPAASRALRILGGVAARLSPTQKRFNKLLARVESLRAAQEQAAARWDRALADYVTRIHPLETALHDRRVEMTRALAAVWRAPKGLGKRQRAQLRDLMLAQYDFFEVRPPTAEEADMLDLREELSADFNMEQAAKRKAGANDPRSPFYDPDGDDADFKDDDDELEGIDMSKIHSGMTPEEIFAEMTRQLFEQSGSDGPAAGASGEPKARKASAAQLKKERREAELEEARKRGISTIYKQLAKVLHPDLEQDPARRAEKERLMQELTAAYRSGDLHTLLRLELEFIHREQGDLNHLGEEKLKIYCELLGEQVVGLEEAVRSVPADPRYVALRPHVDPYFMRLPDWGAIEDHLRGQLAAITRRTAELGGPHARQELRIALQEFEAQRKRAERSRLGPGFPGFF